MCLKYALRECVYFQRSGDRHKNLIRDQFFFLNWIYTNFVRQFKCEICIRARQMQLVKKNFDIYCENFQTQIQISGIISLIILNIYKNKFQQYKYYRKSFRNRFRPHTRSYWYLKTKSTKWIKIFTLRNTDNGNKDCKKNQTY